MVPKKSGYTPAEISKKYDINKFRKVLADKNSESVERKTAEMMISNYNLKLAKLALIQESMKGFPQGIPLVAMPYIIENELDAAQFLPDQAQEQMEGEAQPDAETGEARYGANVISTWDTKKFGGMPKAQFGNLGQPSFDEFKQKALHPDQEYVSKRPETKPKPTHKELDALERRVLGLIQDHRSKDEPLPEGLAASYDKIQQAKKAIGKAPEEKPYKGETSWMTPEGEAVRGPAGQEQWMAYSGKNDPNTSYWDRVKGANVFRRDSEKSWFDKETDVIDPRALEALEKIVPGYGKDAEGVGDYLKTLFQMPQKQMNNLLTGYYENPYDTYLRYNKEPESWAAKAAMKYGTDPMIVDAPYNFLAKGVTKGVAKATPHVTKAAGVVGDFAVKYGTKAAQAAADLAIKLYGKITPKLLENVLAGSQKISQIGMHDESAPPEMFNATPSGPIIDKGKSPYDELWAPKKEIKQDSLLMKTPRVKKDTVQAVEEDWDQYKVN